jgi:diaminopimelate decarboxylase
MAMQLPPSANGMPAVPAGALPPRVRAELSRRAAPAGDDPPTPVGGFVYDPSVAAAKAAELRAVLPGWARLCYAIKANSYRPVVAALAAHVDGFEVASAREAELAREVAPAGLLVAAGPGKTAPLLERLLAMGTLVNVESPLELHRVNAAAQRLGRTVDVAIRVNPAKVGVGSGAGAVTLGGAPTPFGIPEPDVPGVLAQAAALPGVRVTGFHVHVLFNVCSADAYVDYVRWCLDWSADTARRHGLELSTVDVGGGLGVPFADSDHPPDPLDLDRLGVLLAELAPPPGCRVVLEPGRYLATECGWYAAQVTDLKQAYGTWFAVLRGGINHFQLPTSWDILHRFAVLPVEHWPAGCPRPEVRDAEVTVAGELCTPEDTLARDVRVDRLRAGDVLVFDQAGSYGWEFAMPEFLGHPPAERWTVG